MKTLSLHFEKARSYEKQDLFEKAISEYELALQESPLSIRILLDYGKLSIRLKDYAKAVQLLKQLVSHNPSDEHFFLLGECLFFLKDFRESIKYLKRSLELNHRYLNSHLLLAVVYESTGNLYKKESYLRNALEVDEKNLRVLWELAHLYFQTYRYREALQFLERIESIQPSEEKKVNVLKVEILVRMGKFASAKEIVLELMERDEKVRKMINLVLSDPAKRNEIEAKLKQIKSQFKENENSVDRNPKIAMELSILYLSVGNFDAASKFLIYSRKTLEDNRRVPANPRISDTFLIPNHF